MFKNLSKEGEKIFGLLHHAEHDTSIDRAPEGLENI